MKKQLAMVIDASKCIDCKGCQASCKVANQLPPGQWRNWIKSEDPQWRAKNKKSLTFQPGNCMQCSKATCVSACPTGATYRDLDGVVMIDRRLCLGCGQCIGACPYGARFRNEELKVADKCDFCSQRRAVGLQPACVSTCPTKARVFGDINDPKSQAAKLLKKNQDQAVRVVNQKTNTDPNIYYLGDPGPKHWPHEAKMPGALEFWKNLADPAVKIAVGLTGLGVLAMLGKQFLMKNDAPPQDHDQEGGGHE
jgi:Fe-S-cluster-containing dehydrogenase component